MNKTMKSAIAALTAAASVLTVIPASAQPMRGSGWDRHDTRGGWRGTRDRGSYRWNTYGGRYGYNGYHGRWRTGQRYRYYNNRSYWINDWGSYGLPAPRRGYRYYRDDNGDIILAAIGTGIIASILATR